MHYKMEQKNEMVAIRGRGVKRSHGNVHTRLESNHLIILLLYAEFDETFE